MRVYFFSSVFFSFFKTRESTTPAKATPSVPKGNSELSHFVPKGNSELSHFVPKGNFEHSPSGPKGWL